MHRHLTLLESTTSVPNDQVPEVGAPADPLGTNPADSNLFSPEITNTKIASIVKEYCTMLQQIWIIHYGRINAPNELDDFIMLNNNDNEKFSFNRKKVEELAIYCVKKIELFIAMLDFIKRKEPTFTPNIQNVEVLSRYYNIFEQNADKVDILEEVPSYLNIIEPGLPPPPARR